MKILIATEHLALVGGTEKYLQCVIPGLMELGHAVEVVHGDIVPHGARTIDTHRRCHGWSLEALGLERVLEYVGQWEPDVVYCHGLRSSELEEALLSAYPVVLYAHGYYGTCATGTKSHALPVLRPCSRNFGPACLLMHLPRRCGGLNPLSAWRLYQLQTRRLSFLSRYQSVLVASRHMEAEFANHGVSKDRLHLLHYPVTDISPTPAVPIYRRPKGRIVFMGRLTRVKGLQNLLLAMRSVQETLGYRLNLTIIGMGSEEGVLRSLARRVQFPVEFIGWADGEQRIRKLEECDLLAVPSLWPEPFGLVGLEAACLGIPAVAFNVGGIPDWLENGVTGELAPGDPPTAKGLAAAIVRALQDPAHYNRLRRGAWEIAHEFGKANHLAKLESILTSALTGTFVADLPGTRRLQASHSAI